MPISTTISEISCNIRLKLASKQETRLWYGGRYNDKTRHIHVVLTSINLERI